MPDTLRRIAGTCLFVLATWALRAHAITPDQLPPVDSVFVPSAQYTDGAIEVRWTIAKGYYLYRHRIGVQSDSGFVADALRMPKGDAHHDEFFGDVETYRGSLVATLPGTPQAASTVVTIKYQGCADAGVCYPPQTRKLTVALPADATPAQTAPSRSPFALARGAATAGVDAAPLPQDEAFRFEAIPDTGNRVLVRFTPAPGYYLYRDRTTFRLDAASRAAGFALGTPHWPPARKHHDEHFGDVAVYFDEADLTLPLTRTTTAARTIKLTARFQGCQTDGICYPPMERTADVDLPVGVVGAVAAQDVAPTPSSSGAADNASMTASPDTASTASPATTSATSVAMPAREAPPAPRSVAAGGALSALMLALLGGLVLNLMPCVLPVLSLKALSLAESGSPSVARRHAFGYTSGVVLSFLALGGLALALRHAGRALGWGFQLQEPIVVALLALVMFALGLSLSGLWYAGGRWTGAGHSLTQRGGFAGDFFTGVLAVVVATPCTAPFMGAALAWAFLAPTPLALAVFVALGIGLALPFILIGALPGLAALLPRPGAWMETLKEALAFPLYLTSAWLLWVLGRQRGPDAIAWTLAAAVAIAFAAWAWSRTRHRGRAWGAVALVLALAGAGAALATVHRLPRPTASVAADASHEVFSEARLAALRAEGRVVFVNITADWCVSCKANERAVFARPAFAEAMRATNAVYLVGDYTDVDPVLTAFLQRHGAVGVPLYVVYPRRGESKVLPTLLTPAMVTGALADAAR
ncbi:cytochrome C biogenesis protein [Lysobacter sp. TY2-98]|uniref:protein-disulfide reductase DsbD family protein n=1 Tax=Lysobacter sp. TY2-98 TaxID=2290922 RepID=UPI000E209C0A|nr:protein-disulfide reductase DsbD [Lysobacter sp. TY2-98]AXK72665.1 cytochrome C biogenesis protein [Lysobacter sp. TY2-98]